MSKPGFWEDHIKASKISAKLSHLKEQIRQWDNLNQRFSDLKEFALLATKENDAESLKAVEKEIIALQDDLKSLELQHLFSQPEDIAPAILNLHPGAGGTESQDWVEMLMRMYMRWAENRGFATEILDLLPGDVAGIKNVTVRIIGSYAYGNLKGESGVHRLVRISPFDANKRRHTSFASVFVYADIEDDIAVSVNDEELKVETFRASGPGGQHVNTSSTAVRITHLPTGITASCQNERSQLRNRETAMKILKAKLYSAELQKKQAQQAEIESQKRPIEWGSQIRSYVMQPYTLVKDLRTEAETSNVQAVLDGDIDLFIKAFLLSAQNNPTSP